MEPWLTHTLTAVGSLLVGATPLLLGLRKTAAAEWKRITESQGRRIDALEARIEALHREHQDCLAAQAALQLKIQILEAQLKAK